MTKKKKKRTIQQRTANIPAVIRELAWIIRGIYAPIYINEEGGVRNERSIPPKQLVTQIHRLSWESGIPRTKLGLCSTIIFPLPADNLLSNCPKNPRGILLFQIISSAPQYDHTPETYKNLLDDHPSLQNACFDILSIFRFTSTCFLTRQLFYFGYLVTGFRTEMLYSCRTPASLFLFC